MNDLTFNDKTFRTTEITLYKAHKTSVGYWSIHAETTENSGTVIVINHAKSATGKPVDQIIPVKGKNIGRSNETTPFQQAQLEVQSRINKQLDKGYTYTVPELGAVVTNTLGKKKPMLATPINKVKPEVIDWSRAFVQPKLDGHRAMFKDGVLYSRPGKEINLPHILDAIFAAGLEELHLDGEIYWHGKTLQEIGSLIKKPRAESQGLAYYVYDLVTDQPYHSRLCTLDEVIPSNVDAICLTASRRVSGMESVLEYHAECVERGFEGAILRHGTTGYEDDTRSKSLLKIKGYIGEEGDTEATIIGVKQGTPYIRPDATYECAVLICRTPEGAEFDATAPGTMQQKHEAWVNRESMIGKQLTYKFFCYSKDNIPQQPVALRIREDI